MVTATRKHTINGRSLAIKKARAMGYHLDDQRGFYIYQFPAGHWGYASYDSPIGHDLRDSGFIYPTIGCKARAFELIGGAS